MGVLIIQGGQVRSILRQPQTVIDAHSCDTVLYPLQGSLLCVGLPALVIR